MTPQEAANRATSSEPQRARDPAGAGALPVVEAAGVSRCLNAAPAGALSRPLGFRPQQQFANHSSFWLCPANESKIVLPHVRDDHGQKGEFRDEEGSRLGERAPIPRDSFVVPSNRGLPSPSKLVSLGT